MLRLFSKIVFKLQGWKLNNNFDPNVRKAVIIGAPHTSNWDFFYAVLALKHERIKIRIIAKKSLFIWPLGGIMRALGSVPVDRKKSQNFVDGTTQLFKESEELLIGLSPEGTRSLVTKWKTGFYYLAKKAEVPIYLGYMDYDKKELGLSKPFYPTDDREKDYLYIQQFYKDKGAKNKAKWSLEGITNS